MHENIGGLHLYWRHERRGIISSRGVGIELAQVLDYLLYMHVCIIWALTRVVLFIHMGL